MFTLIQSVKVRTSGPAAASRRRKTQQRGEGKEEEEGGGGDDDGRRRKKERKKGAKIESLVRKRRGWATPAGSAEPKEGRKKKRVETCCRINEEEGERFVSGTSPTFINTRRLHGEIKRRRRSHVHAPRDEGEDFTPPTTLTFPTSPPTTSTSTSTSALLSSAQLLVHSLCSASPL